MAPDPINNSFRVPALVNDLFRLRLRKVIFIRLRFLFRQKILDNSAKNDFNPMPVILEGREGYVLGTVPKEEEREA